MSSSEVRAGASAGEDTHEDTIIVDTSNLSELKATCDDAVERILTRAPEVVGAGPSRSGFSPPFTASHVHTDVRLALGFTGSIIMIACAAWSYLVEPEWSVNKGPTLYCVALFAILSGLQMLSSHLQGDTIVLCKRRTTTNGIVQTETLRVRSAPTLPKPKLYNAGSAEARTARLLPGTSITSDSATAKTARPVCIPPVYALSFSYTQTSNGGKTLVKQSDSGNESIPLGHFGEWFTQNGDFREEIFEERLRGALAKIME
ncbi:hypothetical protein K437DRAFT_258079 [Tilletiaria anomala UBC 951]|uniref:Signal peptidase complex subunit 2 n=1 Tax=Tilletiaria anomala (strain ATCC 24038 / CBS 436.72 / UBC 951) TaxID=1037660 RepID=A0A066VK96_TILAU|nr:uncharacterized protein K437DRAFT_258079 [Tilletiaria anomala UBC 951]KDN41856.1 hypothetical protein K437DRAFT_258079 [Tilletiaria anomala UBC 951]